ncbi:unnamed protein product [Ixodes persulcatus]
MAAGISVPLLAGHSEGSRSFKTSEESPDTATATQKRARGPAQDLRQLCSPLGFGASMLKLDYPLPLLQPRSLLEAMTDLFACPELFVSERVGCRACALQVTCVYAEYRPSGISLMVQLRPEAFSVGSYLQLRARGKASLYLVEYAEEYDVEFPAGCVRDVDGKPWFELCGTVTLSCRTTGFRAVIQFLAKVRLES